MDLKIKKIKKRESKPVATNPKKKVASKKALKEPTPRKVQGEDRYCKHVDEKPFGMNDILIYFYEKYEGDWDDIYKAIQRKERVDATEAKSFLKKYRNKYDYVTLIDNEYPDEYKANYKPPFVIRKRKKNDKKD